MAGIAGATETRLCGNQSGEILVTVAYPFAPPKGLVEENEGEEGSPYPLPATA